MEAKAKKQAAQAKESKVFEQKPKSKFTLFWENNPNGILEIVNMRAVLR
jgi:hypothetical protein